MGSYYDSILLTRKLNYKLNDFFLYLLKELKEEDWAKYNYYKHFDLTENVPDNIDRIDCETYSYQHFMENYEKVYKPVILTNSQSDWQASEKWTLNVCFKVLLYF